MATSNDPGLYRKAIASFSLIFAKRIRVTLLLLIATLGVGFLSYTSLLQREGFPPIEVPVGIVQTTYFVDDTQKVDSKVTRPIEIAIASIPEVTQVDSSTNENFSLVVANFDSSITSEEGIELVQKEVEKIQADLPELADTSFQTFKASSIDGENDLLFTISSEEYSILEQQEKAQEIALEIQELSEVQEANVIEQITFEIDVETGEEFEFTSAFQRVGADHDGDFEFSDAVAIGVVKRSDSIGTLELSDAIREKVDELVEDGTLDDYEVAYGGDFAPSLRDQISSLESNALYGLIFVVIMLIIFVSWRASIISAIFIPTVMTATFVALLLIGYSLNVLTLFALILVLGLLVDDAIVVIEAIERKRQNGARPLEAIKESLYEIGPADISGTLTTLLVFAPMTAVTGVLGDFIRIIPITVIVALTLSLVIALSFIPFMTLFTLRGKRTKKLNGPAKTIDTFIYGLPKSVDALGNVVTKFIDAYLKRPGTIVLMAIIGFVIIGMGGAVSTALELNIFPPPKDADEIAVNITYLPETQIERARDIALEIEQILVNTVGEENLRSAVHYFADENAATISAVLTPMADRDVTASRLVSDLEDIFAEYDDAQVKPFVSAAGPPTEDYQFFMQIFADDQETLESATSEFSTYLSNKEIADGVEVTEVLVTELDVVAKRDNRRFAQVKAKLSDTTNATYVLDLEEEIQSEYDARKLAQIGLEDDAIEFDKGQESENQESFASTFTALIFALIIMIGLLVVQFNSFSQPFLILMAIPLSFPGLFPGLYITDNPFGFFTMIGIIGLSGIVVNNTIMLMDFANQQRNQGKSIRESIVHAVHTRFRPLVTTSVTTVVGLLPLSLSDPFWESLAFSIIFGLLSSTVMVILVFPAYYAIVEWMREIAAKARRVLLKAASIELE